MFNKQVPLPGTDEVFLMNTFTDGQAIVSRDVIALLERLESEGDAVLETCTADEREALAALTDAGFIAASRGEERAALEQYFAEFREDASRLRVTVLTTLQCNFSCDYCIQGDHGDGASAERMTLETASHVAAWAETRLDVVRPERFVLTFFGGEPLVNLPVVYYLASRLWTASKRRGVELLVNVITNGLLLTPGVVDRLVPFGLNGVKVTLDGDREAHDRMRPLRGGQGTFDRVVRNLRDVAGRVRLTIGGNFDASNVDSYPALLAFLREQPFANAIARVNFKPIIRQAAGRPSGRIPLTAVGADGRPPGGACMTVAGPGGSHCDTCQFVDERMASLREETRRHGFATADGVHMGPCELHRRHAYAVGPDGSLYACPGFAGDKAHATGHVDEQAELPARAPAASVFEAIAAWKQCGDCAFIPVCGGGCTVAAHHELGDMAAPSCHRDSFESALVSLAYATAGTSGKEVS